MKAKYLLASVSASTLALAGGAHAADMPVKVAHAPVFSPTWEGLYIGLNVGVSSLNSTTKDLDAFTDIGYVPNLQQRSTGVTAGGQIGYNWQEEFLVYGVEADINWTDNKSTTHLQNTSEAWTAGVKSNMDWMATFRARAGITLGAAAPTLLYVTGGLAVAHINNRWGIGYNGDFQTTDFVSNNVKLGWVAGAGIEHKLRGMPNWSIKAEALYAVFENDTVSTTSNPFLGRAGTFRTEFQNDVATARLGVNYKW
jgi:outer membrane immunogenic protein